MSRLRIFARHSSISHGCMKGGVPTLQTQQQGQDPSCVMVGVIWWMSARARQGLLPSFRSAVSASLEVIESSARKLRDWSTSDDEKNRATEGLYILSEEPDWVQGGDVTLALVANMSVDPCMKRKLANVLERERMLWKRYEADGKSGERR